MAAAVLVAISAAAPAAHSGHDSFDARSIVTIACSETSECVNQNVTVGEGGAVLWIVGEFPNRDAAVSFLIIHPNGNVLTVVQLVEGDVMVHVFDRAGAYRYVYQQGGVTGGGTVDVFDDPPAHAAVLIPDGASVPGMDCVSRHGCLVPPHVVVTRSGEVTWLNGDTASTALTSGTPGGGPDGRFESGLFLPGETFSFEFDDVGTYPYFGIVHPWLVGRVTVVGPVAPVPEDGGEDRLIPFWVRDVLIYYARGDVSDVDVGYAIEHLVRTNVVPAGRPPPDPITPIVPCISRAFTDYELGLTSERDLVSALTRIINAGSCANSPSAPHTCSVSIDMPDLAISARPGEYSAPVRQVVRNSGNLTIAALELAATPWLASMDGRQTPPPSPLPPPPVSGASAGRAATILTATLVGALPASATEVGTAGVGGAYAPLADGLIVDNWLGGGDSGPLWFRLNLTPYGDIRAGAEFVQNVTYVAQCSLP